MIEPLDVLFAQGFVPLLHSLDAILEKAATYAEEKRLDLVNARLAPDMFTLAQQIQIATYFARETPSRLMGREAAFDIGEAATTIEGMRKQVSDALASLALLDASAFDGAGTRRCTIEPPNVDFYFDMSGDEFLLRWSLPNFYFHLVIAYAILRKEGLAIGKLDYLGSIEEFRRSKA